MAVAAISTTIYKWVDGIGVIRMKPSFSGLLLLLVASWPASAADICKWADEKGVTHYSNVKPADRPCQKLIRVINPDPEEQRRADERHKRQLDELKAIENARAIGATEAATQAEQEADRERRCQDAKAELKFLEEAYGMRLVRPAMKGSEGPFDWIDDKEREDLTDSWRKQVEEWCGSSRPSSISPTPERAYGAPPPIRLRRPLGRAKN